jgi:hypothetical protein
MTTFLAAYWSRSPGSTYKTAAVFNYAITKPIRIVVGYLQK